MASKKGLFESTSENTTLVNGRLMRETNNVKRNAIKIPPPNKTFLA
jgi:hypothetical protein